MWQASKAQGKKVKKEEAGSDDDKPLASAKSKGKVKEEDSDDDKPLAAKSKPSAKGKAVSFLWCG